MKRGLLAVVLMSWGLPALAGDSNFSAHLQAKFQVKACTVCHDFFEKKLGGLSFKSHKGRTPDMCVGCHTQDVTGFKEEDEWFAMPGLYLSRMNSRQTCQAVMSALHAKFKNPTMVARQLKKHLFEDPRMLWGIEGALPNSGMLPEDKRQTDLVKGGLQEWEKQVNAWIEGGMKCK